METKDFFIYNNTYINEPIKIYPTQFGWQKVKTACNKNAIKDCYVLHIILSGKGNFYVGNKRYSLNENQAFLLRPGKMVTYFTGDKDPWEYVWMGFNGDDVEKYFFERGIDKDMNVFNLHDSERFRKITKNLFAEYKESRADPILAHRTLLHFLQEFFSQADNGQTIQSVASDLDKAIKYIVRNYREDVSITQLCKYILINRTTLYKMFEKAFGVSPQEYIIMYKLEQARILVVETNISFKLIAFNCGYSVYPHFSKSFKKYYGMSPQEYRDKNTSQNKAAENKAIKINQHNDNIYKH